MAFHEVRLPARLAFGSTGGDPPGNRARPMNAVVAHQDPAAAHRSAREHPGRDPRADLTLSEARTPRA